MASLPATLGPYTVTNRLDQAALFTLPLTDSKVYNAVNPRTAGSESCATAEYRRTVTIAPADNRDVLVRLAINLTSPQARVDSMITRTAETMATYLLGADDGAREYPVIWPFHNKLMQQMYATYLGYSPRGALRPVRLLSADETVLTFAAWVPGTI